MPKPRSRSVLRGRLGCFLVLGVLVLGWLGMGSAGFFMTPWLSAAASRKAESGASILAAIYRYRGATGLFPMQLEDLVPGQLDAATIAGWDLSWAPYVWSLTTTATAGGGWVVVRFTSHEAREPVPRWEYQVNRDTGGSLDVTVDIATLIREGGSASIANAVDEFERRIRECNPAKLWPGLAEHYKGLVTLQMDSGLWRDAVGNCLAMRRSGLEPWWSEQALARARHMLGDSELARTELVRWIEAAPSFHAYTFLASFHRAGGDREKALLALGLAADHGLGNGDSNYVAAAYAYDAAVYAYSEGEFELVVRICDRWQAFFRSAGYDESCPRHIRAAANLAMGNLVASRVDAAVVTVGRATWAGDPTELFGATGAGNTAWRATFDPGTISLNADYQ